MLLSDGVISYGLLRDPIVLDHQSCAFWQTYFIRLRYRSGFSTTDQL